MDNVYLYIFVMAIVTFAIRALPLTLIRGEIKSKKIRSFLYYVPYVTLSAMTFPAILSATSDIRSAAAGLIAALVLAVMKRGLLIVATGACLAVLLVEMLPI